MVRGLLAEVEPEEVAQRHRIGATPRDAAFAVEALKVADEHHAHVHARSKLGRPLPST